nr:hypothetical protein [Tanacetum cinerariifolium]
LSLIIKEYEHTRRPGPPYSQNTDSDVFDFLTGRSRSCPFCKKTLKSVNLTDLWTCVESSDTIEQPNANWESLVLR